MSKTQATFHLSCREEGRQDHLVSGRGSLTRNNRMSRTPRPTRYSSFSLRDVICLCAGPRDDEAWEEFVSRVGKPISLTVMRTASLWGTPSRSLVEDLTQVTY